MSLFIKLMIGHFLADYPLQGDFLSKAKNHKNPVPNVPWYQALFAHAALQAGAVWLITDNYWVAGAELVLHFVIDYLKCNDSLSFNEDQVAHTLCKAVYAALLG